MSPSLSSVYLTDSQSTQNSLLAKESALANIIIILCKRAVDKTSKLIRHTQLNKPLPCLITGTAWMASFTAQTEDKFRAIIDNVGYPKGRWQ